MAIVICKIRRKGGTRVDLPGKSYHFKPTAEKPDGDHVAEVTDQSHLARFAEIPESFVVSGGKLSGGKSSADSSELEQRRAELDRHAKTLRDEIEQERNQLNADRAQLNADRAAFEQEKVEFAAQVEAATKPAADVGTVGQAAEAGQSQAKPPKK